MKILKMPNGEELKITGENGRFYITEKASFRKANYAGCVVEIKEEKAKREPLPFEMPEEAQEEPAAEPKPKKKTAKKPAVKAEKIEEKE